MVMTDIIQLKKQLSESWENLMNEKLDVELRKLAYKNVVVMTNEIRDIDKTFSLNEKALEKYSKFRPADTPQLETSVKWVKPSPNTSLEKEYNEYVSIALSIVQQRCPNLPADGDKFGTIVNAVTQSLINIDLIKALQELPHS